MTCPAGAAAGGRDGGLGDPSLPAGDQQLHWEDPAGERCELSVGKNHLIVRSKQHPSGESELPVAGGNQVEVALSLPSGAKRAGQPRAPGSERMPCSQARERQQNLTPWKPQLFRLDPATQEWRYLHEE